MECPRCKAENPADATRCQGCNAPLGLQGATATLRVPAGWSVPVSPAFASGLPSLVPGSKLGDRYEILQLLGEGGMGAVYKAHDGALDRVVAVKVIRPELTGRPEILQRFKQEIILARQISHKNVIRIFDLGEADGMKFITMDYVEGVDLKALLREKGKVEPAEAVRLIEQVAQALDAAHAEGVIHRDLKPQNIMLDTHGKIVVMDFGIARSVGQGGLTQTGGLVGTPEYMSPEQAIGQKLDTRSDLFPLGIIFYELLTGQGPYPAETAVASLMKRIHEAAVPPVGIDPSLPQALSDVAVKCLARKPEGRYQTAAEVIADLEAWRAPPPGPTTTTVTVVVQEAPPRMVAALRHWKWAAAALLVVLLVVAGVLVRDGFGRRNPALQKTVKLLIADFRNNTGEPVFDGTLEPMFAVAMEGASFITSYNRVQARALAPRVQPGATVLEEGVARLVAVREGVQVVVAGSIERLSDGYLVAVKAMDAATGKALVTRDTKVSTKEAVLAAVGKLAVPIRKALGDTTPESAQITAAETFTAASIEAAHVYGLGQEAALAGRRDEAIRHYLHAIEADVGLGRAYSGLAVLYHNRGQVQEADKYFQLALKRIDRMSERERYRTRGTYYVAMRNYEKAIEDFSALVKQYPADSAGYANMAIAYLNLRNFPKALEQGRKAIEIYPRNVSQRNNVALFALYGSDFPTAAQEARRVLELNPNFEKAFFVLAMSELAQGRPDQAVEHYRRLEKVSALGSSYAAIGLADLALYEGRWGDAAALLEKGIQENLAAQDSNGAGDKLAAMAFLHLARGQKSQAAAAADRALAASKHARVVIAAADAYLQAGQEAKARALARELGARLEPEVRSYAKLIEGEALRLRNKLPEALQVFQEARKLFDTWLARLYVGRTYLDAGAFAEAYSEFEQCLKRRGEVTAFFFDEIPTYRYLPAVYYYQGRAQDGLGSDDGAASYQTFLAIKQKAERDPMVEDAKRRVAGR